MEALFLLAIPVVVTALTEAVKQIPKIETSSRKAVILRFFALSASFGGVVAASMASGVDVPATEIQTYGEALVIFMSTQIPYLLGKKSGTATQ